MKIQYQLIIQIIWAFIKGNIKKMNEQTQFELRLIYFSKCNTYIMKDDSIINTSTKEFAFFLGKIYFEIKQFKSSINFKESNIIINDVCHYLDDKSNCQCTSSYISKDNIGLNGQDRMQIASEYRNCDKFSVQFWIKFNQIFQLINEFQYLIFKMHSNSKDERLLNENLSPFQLFYKLSKVNQNKIIFTTYSYDLPTINLNFTQNQFLITKGFDLDKDLIYLWQSISVVLDDKLYVQIKIYNGLQIISFTDSLNVNHFHQMNFFMKLGNIQNNQQNYISFYLYSFIFDNCEIHQLEKVCHPSCLECDGPTKNDCLACDVLSYRIFLPQYKICICPYNMIDESEICLNYENLELSLINSNAGESKALTCNYGYYQEDDETCVKCPSMIGNNIVTCLECLLNPYSWKLEPICETIQVQDKKQEETFQQLNNNDYLKIIYQFDGNAVTMCDGCHQQQDSYGDFQEVNVYFKQFCQISWKGAKFRIVSKLNPNVCYNSRGLIQNCEYLKFKKTQFECSICEKRSFKIDGQCYPSMATFSKYKNCFAPFYLNFQRQCIKCPISNCIYCFEYQDDDLSYSTLYKDFKFNQDAYFSIGCALCEDGYQFNFISGICEIQNIQIEHCLRSYINLKNKELYQIKN